MFSFPIVLKETVGFGIITYVSSFLVASQTRGDNGWHSRDDRLLVRGLAAPTTLFPVLLLTEVCQVAEI